MNSERQKAGVKPLKKGSTQLYNAAKLRSKEILQFYDHTRPNGQHWDTVLTGGGIKYISASETLATGQSTPKELIMDVMDNEFIRDSELTNLSISVAAQYEEDRWQYYWVLIFIGT